MRYAAIGLVVWATLGAAAAGSGKPVPSAPLRAYKGPEGELIVMVEVDDGKQMLVHFRHVSRELDGKTLLYQLEDLGDGTKNVFTTKKRGSKTYRNVILAARTNKWRFFYPDKNTDVPITYSEEASGQTKLDDVMNAYKP